MGWFRSPKTFNEIKASTSGWKVRAARRWRNLPTTWDDVYRTVQRSWKEHRKSQFKDPRSG